MKNLFIIAALLLTSIAYSQGFSNEKNVRLEDYELSPVPSSGMAKAEAHIRKIISSRDTLFLYQIEIFNPFNTSFPTSLTASLTKEDIVEAREALTVLLEQSKGDVESKANYINNKYSFESGFSIGYVIDKKGSVTWFFHQENELREEIFWVKSINEIVKTFSEATVIMEQLENE